MKKVNINNGATGLSPRLHGGINMAEEIKAYKPKCCNKAYIHKSSAIRHEKRCYKNPENKACKMCKYFEYDSCSEVHDELPGSPVEQWDWRICTRNGEGNSINLDEYGGIKFNCEYFVCKEGVEKGESRMEFKVGDKVRGVKGLVKGYKGVVVKTNSGFNGGLILCRFKNFKGHNGNGGTNIGKDYDTSDHWYVFPYEIELIKNETIVIYRKDDKVIALDKRTGKKAEAKCHPDDEFDFKTGAKLAFERLLEEPENKEEYYNGKIIFTKGDSTFKTGHIYEVVDGKIKSPLSGKLFPLGFAFKSLEDVKKYFNGHEERQIWSSSKTLDLIEVLDD